MHLGSRQQRGDSHARKAGLHSGFAPAGVETERVGDDGDCGEPVALGNLLYTFPVGSLGLSSGKDTDARNW